MGFGFEGKRIRLVPLDPDKHLDNVYAWVNDCDVTDTLGFRGTPMSRASEQEWMERIGKDPNNIVWAIELLDGTHIGTSGIHNINLTNGVANTGSFIGVSNLHGQGYGTEASVLRARYGFHVLGLRMLKSTHLGGNHASRRMLEKTGYAEYGRIPGEHWKNGVFHDMVYMLLTKEKFLELHP
ncbi:MAG: GNAT family N-acetyltransferase [Armatimonadetes bacterium]|nr:GNAT family N-acetyltransferase [Armatimonadota bacterium]MBS1703316.1 GNAT family N-acetyltransferase [Armatimonadota bacterium]